MENETEEYNDLEFENDLLKQGRLSEAEAKRFSASELIDLGFRRDGNNWRIES
jgi:hypothetical protein